MGGGRGKLAAPTFLRAQSPLRKDPHKPASPEQEEEERGLDRASPTKTTLPQSWKGDALQPASPPFKSGTGLAPLREKTSLGQRRDPGSQNRAGLAGRCRPALARTSRSNSSECQAAAAGQGEPPSPGGRASGGTLPPCRCSLEVLREPAGGPAAHEGPVGKATAHLSLPVAEVGGGGARVDRRPAERSDGSGVQDQAELAPHVAGRASFTAQPGGGGAERARGSCDRRLSSVGQAEPRSARARPGRPSPGTSAQPRLGVRRAGEAARRRKRRRRSFRMRSRGRSAPLAAIFNEDWAGP